MFYLIFLRSSNGGSSKVFLVCYSFSGQVALVVFRRNVVFQSILLSRVALRRGNFRFQVYSGVLGSNSVNGRLFGLYTLVSTTLRVLARPIFRASNFSGVSSLILLPVRGVGPQLAQGFFRFFFCLGRGLSSVRGVLP